MKKILSLLAMFMMLVTSSFAATSDYLCFEATEANASVALYYSGTWDKLPEVQYSTDGSTWNDIKIENFNNRQRVKMANIGDKVYFKAKDKNATFSKSSSDYISFNHMGGSLKVSGNVMSLLDATCQQTSVPDYAFYMLFHNVGTSTAPELPATTLGACCYYEMFWNCSKLTEAPELPATNLEEGCYDAMFYGCTNLTTAPELPATTLADGCYEYMFYGCTSLTSSPTLPATTLADYCYQNMFMGCTKLTEAPALPATTLSEFCYTSMFEGCTSLESSPTLPATTLVKFCYSRMFYGCTNLNSVDVRFTDWDPYGSTTYDWLANIPTNELNRYFTGPCDLETKVGTSYIPEGWTRIRYGELSYNARNLARLIDYKNEGKYNDLYDLNNNGKLDEEDIEIMKCRILGVHYCPTVTIGGVEWATMNIGAEYMYDAGDYFAWGVTESYYNQKKSYNWQTYCGQESFVELDPKPYNETTLILKPEYDAAHVQWGGNWRMPTKSDFENLLKACGCEDPASTFKPSEATTVVAEPSEKGIYNAGHYLLFVDGEGNKLHLPYAGYILDNTNLNTDSDLNCSYWSSTRCSEDVTNAPEAAYTLWQRKQDEKSIVLRPISYYARSYGLPIRPVKSVKQ